MNRLQQLKFSLMTYLLLAVAAGCGKQSEPAKPGLDGRWTGFDVGQPDAQCTLTIKGNHVDYRGASPTDWLRGTIALNEQAQPAQMDLTIEESGASSDVGTTALMIYELRGDELRVAASKGERPTNLEGGERVRVFAFKRDSGGPP